MRKKAFIFLIMFSLLLTNFKLSFADYKGLCEKGNFFDIIFDIRWEALFPVRIAGVKIKGPSNNPDNPPEETGSGSVVCLCKRGNGKYIMGVTVSYWNPARAIETTKIPWCLSTIQKFLDFGDYWKNLGTNTNQKDITLTFTNAHNWKFNLLDMLNLFMDIPCVPHEGIDVFYFSELDPTWNDPILAYFMHPEAILFANPVAQLSCIADASASAMGWSIDQLFWCAGAWGSVYPFVGFNSRGHYLEGNALNMARLLYREMRVGVSWDTAIDECGAVLTPIWIKSHYKFHQLKPVRGPILTIGKPMLLWEYSKNPPGGTSKGSADNFSWVVWKLVKCCMGFSN
ncbi:MAG: conjugal transfer pilus assembly protein TraU [Petrotoga sp.]|nr:conjugal transfer pilus assembly protein TraU [Petrotoga sp.]